MARDLNYLKAVENFKKYLTVDRAYSKLTVKEYDHDLKLLYKYLKNEQDFDEDFNISQISKYEISEFLSDIVLSYDNSAVTRNRKLYAIRSFFKFLQKREYIEKNPAMTIESSKTRTTAEPIYLKLDEAKKYIKVIKEADLLNKKRDLAIVKLFLYAGLRVSELVELDLEDIDYEDKSIKFFGKGNKERYVPLHADTINSIKQYLPERNKIDPNDKDAEKALFLSTRGNRISPRSIQLFVKKYAKMAGIKNASKVTPHKLRHTFATMLYNKTKNIKVLQDLLGHENISTTQIYTHTDQKQKKEAIDELPDF
ncbi:MAG: tyrosine-type recombinase/integrase [Halanaerobiales bacterium]|nr:tyrosine-type recombinase/integrase [Halanaerobiales bacterium]